jgi:hypothetical protein
MKRLRLHVDQHLYCDFNEKGIGDTCLLCGGDIRLVSYAPCPKGREMEIKLKKEEHIFLGKETCLLCQRKEGSCSFDKENIYLQY